MSDFKISWLLFMLSIVTVKSAQCKTTKGESCVFPMRYKDLWYDACTNRNHNEYWCATKLETDGSYAKWGNCESTCPKGTGRLDCWDTCGSKGGSCDICGVRQACCRKGWDDPSECAGAQIPCDGYHCCSKQVGQELVIANAPGAGGWGGRCKCPSGTVYKVGDNGDACESLACVGGDKLGCTRSDGAWSHRMVLCFGLSFSLIKKNHECSSSDDSLGKFSEVSLCAIACQQKEECTFFIYGEENRKCYWEHTSSEDCPGGWEMDKKYDFYELKRATSSPTAPPTAPPTPPTARPIIHVRGYWNVIRFHVTAGLSRRFQYGWSNYSGSSSTTEWHTSFGISISKGYKAGIGLDSTSAEVSASIQVSAELSMGGSASFSTSNTISGLEETVYTAIRDGVLWRWEYIGKDNFNQENRLITQDMVVTNSQFQPPCCPVGLFRNASDPRGACQYSALCICEHDFCKILHGGCQDSARYEEFCIKNAHLCTNKENREFMEFWCQKTCHICTIGLLLP